MQPIETVYKGYRFRSRLEARWAVFFDAMNIKWDYEPEGFVLDDGTHYLPDFWLPDFNSFAEVKADIFTDEEKRKCELLAKEKCVILLSGVPEVKTYEQLFYMRPPKWVDDNDPDSGAVLDSEGNIVEDEPRLMSINCHLNEKRFLEIIKEKTGTEFNLYNEVSGITNISESSEAIYALNESFVELQEACIRAKQARFEHGERG